MARHKAPPTETRLPRSVLLVEDEKNQRQMLTRALTEMEFTVTPAESAEAALKLLDKLCPTLVMLDLNLPGMSGMELAEQIQQLHPNIRMIILTGYGDLETARRAIRLDVVDFLLKPCPLDELERALCRALLKANDTAELPEARELKTPTPPPQTEHPQRLDHVERQLITEALARHDGNRNAVAEELGVSVRTIYYRLARYEAEDRLRQNS